MNYIQDIKQRAEDAGFKMADVCREAGINQAQMSRWIAGKTVPLISSIEKLVSATDRLIARRIEMLDKIGKV